MTYPVITYKPEEQEIITKPEEFTYLTETECFGHKFLVFFRYHDDYLYISEADPVSGKYVYKMLNKPLPLSLYQEFFEAYNNRGK